jgi:hypothetical protein
MIAKLGVLYLAHGIIDSIIPFLIWLPTATWGYYKLTNYFEEQQHDEKELIKFITIPTTSQEDCKGRIQENQVKKA